MWALEAWLTGRSMPDPARPGALGLLRVCQNVQQSSGAWAHGAELPPAVQGVESPGGCCPGHVAPQ